MIQTLLLLLLLLTTVLPVLVLLLPLHPHLQSLPALRTLLPLDLVLVLTNQTIVYVYDQ